LTCNADPQWSFLPALEEVHEASQLSDRRLLRYLEASKAALASRTRRATAHVEAEMTAIFVNLLGV